MNRMRRSSVKSLAAFGMGLVVSLAVVGDVSAQGVQTHSFNGGAITLTVEPTGWPGDSVTICNVTENGGLDPSKDLRQLDDISSDDLTDPYTFWGYNQKFVIWKTEDQDGVLHWWLACWERSFFTPYSLKWSTEITHD